MGARASSASWRLGGRSGLDAAALVNVALRRKSVRVAETRSRDPDVLVLARDAPLLLGQIGLPDRGHDRPVLPDRAMLDPPPAEPNRLHRHRRNPDRRVQVTALAPDHDVSSGPARAPPYGAGLNENGGNAEHKSPATTLTSTSRTPALLTPIDECDNRSPFRALRSSIVHPARARRMRTGACPAPAAAPGDPRAPIRVLDGP
jgi:hypothetical protein